MWHDYCRTEIPREPSALTVAQWKRLSDLMRDNQIGQLRRWLEHLYLPTEELTAINTVMTAIVRSNAQSPPGAKDVIVVTGPNVVGKSTLMMRGDATATTSGRVRPPTIGMGGPCSS